MDSSSRPEGNAAEDSDNLRNPAYRDDLDERERSPEPDPDFAPFETFPEREQALPVVRLLNELGIPYLLEENRLGFDPSFANNVVYQAWVLKLPPDRFEEARRSLEESLSDQDLQLPSDHYLREFSLDELRDVLAKPDEWSELDVVMARQLLEQKGHPLSELELEQMRSARRAELARPEPAGSSMIASAYLLALAGGVFGILLGWVLSSSTRTTAFGDVVPSYDEASRRHGRRALQLGSAVLIIALGLVLLRPLWLT
jgi:hypothetical protein